MTFSPFYQSICLSIHSLTSVILIPSHNHRTYISLSWISIFFTSFFYWSLPRSTLLVSHCYPLIAFLSFQCHILFSPCFLPHYFLLFTSISSNFILSFCCTILLHWCFYCLEENRFPFPLLNMHAPNSCRRHIRVPYPSLF